MKYVVIERDVRDDELDAIFGVWVFDREADAIAHATAIERGNHDGQTWPTAHAQQPRDGRGVHVYGDRAERVWPAEG